MLNLCITNNCIVISLRAKFNNAIGYIRILRGEEISLSL